MKKRIQYTYTALLIGLMIIGICVLTATMSILADSELESQYQALNAKDLDNLLSQAEDDAQAQQLLAAEMEKQVSELNDNMLLINSQLETINGQIDDKQIQIDEAQLQVQSAKDKAQDQYNDMKLRIQFMYENQDSGFIELLLSGEGLSDILSSMEYINQLSNYDRNRLSAYENTLSEVTQEEAKLQAQQEELLALQNELVVKREETSQAITTAQNNIILCQEALVRYTDSAAQIQDQIDLRDELEGQIRESMSEAEEESIQASIEESIEASVEASREEQSIYDESVQESIEESMAIESSIAQQQSIEESINQQEQSTTSADTTSSGEETSPDTTIPVNPDYSAQELDMLAAIVYCEAGGEGYEGKVGVAQVVLNRMKSSLYPATMQEVLYQSNQFAPVWMGWYANVLAFHTADASCYGAAQDAMNGANIVGDRLYFRSIPEEPKDYGLIIGNIYFY